MPRHSLLAVVLFALGTFPATHVRAWSPPKVTTLADSGEGSLRDVVGQLAIHGSFPIRFEPGLEGEIVLTSGPIVTASRVDLRGPGASKLTVRGDDASGILAITQAMDQQSSVIGVTFEHGGGASGGALSVTGGSLTVVDCVFADNAAGSAGGGLHVASAASVTIEQSVFVRNRASRGGALAIDFVAAGATLTLRDVRVEDNVALAGAGGGIDVTAGINGVQGVVLERVFVRRNEASAEGGGVSLYNVHACSMLASAFEANRSGLDGGGLRVLGSAVTLTNVTVAENEAGANGGGIFHPGYDFTARNVTISGNEAEGDGGGAVVHREVALHESTVTGNRAGRGGGVAYRGGEYDMGPYLENTIVHGNIGQEETTDIDPYGFPVRAHRTIVGVMPLGGFSPASSVLVGVDPLLAPLGDYGGFLRTHALRAGSPALDAGAVSVDDPPFPTDQRGRLRVQGGTIDLGAVEGVEPALLVTSVVEPSGESCTYGGVRTEAGLDRDTDGSLDVDEVTERAFTCADELVPPPAMMATGGGRCAAAPGASTHAAPTVILAVLALVVHTRRRRSA